MTKRAVVIFPSEDMDGVERIRARWDPLADVLAGHITLMYPFDGGREPGGVVAAVDAVAATTEPFAFELGDPTVREEEYLFLLARTGGEQIRALHEALYARHHLPLPAGFEPHMTIARCPDPVELETARQTAVAEGVSVSGRAASLVVYRIESNGPGIREHVAPLGRPRPPRPPAEPVQLVPVDRSHRSVLENLGQLYRHDLSEAYGLMPNADGTFNNTRLDSFLTGRDMHHRAWLVTAGGSLAGFVMTQPREDGSMTVADLFVVRALRRSGVGRQAARQVIAQLPGRWSIGFQAYNPGVERFWSQVATDVAGDGWATHDDPPAHGRPPDTWITFTT